MQQVETGIFKQFCNKQNRLTWNNIIFSTNLIYKDNFPVKIFFTTDTCCFSGEIPLRVSSQKQQKNRNIMEN